jgi:hypothetical protein
VQWTARAVEECHEFAVRRALGEPTSRVKSCEQVRASIQRALLEGRLSVVMPDGVPVEPAPRGVPPHGGPDNDEATLEQEALELATANVSKAEP